MNQNSHISIIETQKNTIYVKKLINLLNKKGKKNISFKIVNEAFLEIINKIGKDPALVIEDIIKQYNPQIEVISKKIGQKTINVPVLIRTDKKKSSIVLKWILEGSFQRTKIRGKLSMNLANEILESYKGLPSSNVNRLFLELRKKIEDNQVYINFRW